MAGAWSIGIDDPQAPCTGSMNVTQQGSSLSGSFLCNLGSGVVLSGDIAGDVTEAGRLTLTLIPPNANRVLVAGTTIGKGADQSIDGKANNGAGWRDASFIGIR